MAISKGVFDHADVNVPCPGCGAKTKLSLGFIRKNETMKCSGCGKTVHLDKDADFEKNFRSLDKSWNDLKKVFKR